MWCEYFALCDQPAEGIVKNPIIGDVPSCGRCASKMEQTLIPFEPTAVRAEIVVEYTIPTWSAYPVALSAECAPKGSGQCDGHDYDLDAPCDCPCHEVEVPATIAEIKVWHDDMHAGRITEF